MWKRSRGGKPLLRLNHKLNYLPNILQIRLGRRQLCPIIAVYETIFFNHKTHFYQL